MKIKRYPGKAVDASLSLDANNAMGVLYEANWLQAHENFNTRSDTQAPQRKLSPTPSTQSSYSAARHPRQLGGSYLVDGISTLRKYQMSLEQINALEQQSRDERIVKKIKDLNGYKASTLRLKTQRLHDEWNTHALNGVNKTVDESAQTAQDSNKTQKRSSPSAKQTNQQQQHNHYVIDPTMERQQRPRQQISAQPPALQLKRSHTMFYASPSKAKPPLSLPSSSHTSSSPTSSSPSSSSSATLDIKDMRRAWKTEQELKKSKSSSALAPLNTTANQLPTVISIQPQRQRAPLLPTPKNNCDINANMSEIPKPKPRVATISRAKSMRLPHLIPLPINCQPLSQYNHNVSARLYCPHPKTTVISTPI